jgi:hypothetical protein
LPSAFAMRGLPPERTTAGSGAEKAAHNCE